MCWLIIELEPSFVLLENRKKNSEIWNLVILTRIAVDKHVKKLLVSKQILFNMSMFIWQRGKRITISFFPSERNLLMSLQRISVRKRSGNWLQNVKDKIFSGLFQGLFRTNSRILIDDSVMFFSVNM